MLKKVKASKLYGCIITPQTILLLKLVVPRQLKVTISFIIFSFLRWLIFCLFTITCCSLWHQEGKKLALKYFLNREEVIIAEVDVIFLLNWFCSIQLSLISNILYRRYNSYGRLTNITYPTGRVSSYRTEADSSVRIQTEGSNREDITVTTNLSASGNFYTLLQGECLSDGSQFFAWNPNLLTQTHCVKPSINIKLSSLLKHESERIKCDCTYTLFIAALPDCKPFNFIPPVWHHTLLIEGHQWSLWGCVAIS